MISKKKFTNVFGPAVFISALLIFLYLSGAVAMAFPVTGVGGFTIEASSVSGNDLHIYPAMEETDKVSEHPVATLESEYMKLEDFRITKDFNFDDFSDVGTGTMRIVVRSDSSDPTVVEDSIVKAVSMRADRADMENLVMRENTVPSGSNPLGPNDPVEFVQSADEFDLEDMDMQTARMAARRVEMPSPVIVIQFDADNDGTFEFS